MSSCQTRSVKAASTLSEATSQSQKKVLWLSPHSALWRWRVQHIICTACFVAL
jgi:hypothetical protein